MVLVAAGILRRGGEVLACRRRGDQQHAGRWEFPGGKVEQGESASAALRRELREELDIQARVGRPIERYQFEYSEAQAVDLIFFEVESYLGQPDFSKFAGSAWAPPARLVQLDFLEGDRLFLARLAAGQYG